MFLVILLSCRPEPPSIAVGLRLNEVMSANDSLVRDPANPECPEFDDWVELVNASSEPVDLDGITLHSGTDRMALSGIIEPDSVRIIWADNDLEQGPDHAPFKISADGERLELVRGLTVLDSVDVPTSPRDQSWARVEDGFGDWAWFTVPTPGAFNLRALPDDPCFELPTSFKDHSYPCMSTAESFSALSGARTALQVVKFDIFAFNNPSDRRVAYVDTEFYQLHDQFYLFRLFNGQTFEGIYDHRPFDGSFRTWGELESWAASVDLSRFVSPDMARFVGDRLVSRTFYSRINGHPRVVGVGTIVHRDASSETEAFWGFELEHGDNILYEDLVVYFETLARTGPPEFDRIRWLVRSSDQEALAQRMESEKLPFFDQITRYSELATVGEVEVYHPGLTAGRVRRIRAGEPGLDDALPTDILLLDEIPDELPPCAALITSVPQTPLSHISLLARSRGIPNLYVAGITSDPEWDAWNRVITYVALEATDDGVVRAAQIETEEYALWRNLQVQTLPELVQVDVDGLPWTIDLASAGSMLELRPVVGGKAAGMRQLLLADGVDTPDTPMGVTIRAYHEHLDALPGIDDLLSMDPFIDAEDVAMRYLVLEGREAFDDRYESGVDQSAADQFVASTLGTLAGDLAVGGGLRGRVAEAPIPSVVASSLIPEIESQFSWLDPSAGLRFRSSSTVEDIEGFNGAGLYISATGFVNPAAGDPSLEDAIRAVWASYWGAEAFEERDAAGIPHLEGGMGLLVHPRFDDDFELSNAVLTASLLPTGAIELLVNAQDGAVSVANPPTTCPPVLPESLRLVDEGTGLQVQRVGASTEVPVGVEVLSDAQAQVLFDSGSTVLADWLLVENEALPPSQRRSVLTLDLEAREMAAGWPNESHTVPRLVVKQSRSLEPSAAGLPPEIQALPAPRDLLARAIVVERMECTDGALVASVTWLRTDPRKLLDMGFSDQPFVIEGGLEGHPQAGDFDHLEWLTASVSEDAFVFETADVRVDMGAAYSIEDALGTVSGTASCLGETLWASPDELLLLVLERVPSGGGG